MAWHAPPRWLRLRCRPPRRDLWTVQASRLCQRANCLSNVISLGHGLPPWLGLGPVGGTSSIGSRVTVLPKHGKAVNRKGNTEKAGPPGHWSRPGPNGTAGKAPALRSAIEAWAKQQNDKPSRSEAIRRLLEFALAFKAKKRGSQ